ncbi:MAG: glycosyltransferase family 9 protein [bacterium]
MEFFNPFKLAISRALSFLFYPIVFFRGKRTGPIAEIPDYKPESVVILEAALLGDLVMAIPAITLIKKKFPNTHITLLGTDQAKELLYGQNIIDEFISINLPWFKKNMNISSIISLFIKLLDLRRQFYDLAVEFRGDLRNILLLNLLKARRRAALTLSGGVYLLTDPVTYNGELSHQVLRNLQVAEYFCGYGKEPAPKLQINSEEIDWANKFLESIGILSGDKVIGLAPGTSRSFKMWPAANWAQLSDEIQKAGIKVLIMGGSGEEGMVKSIQDRTEIPLKQLFLPLAKIKALLSRLHCFVGVDSGLGHVAAACGIKTITLFGTKQYLYAKPFSDKGEILCGKYPPLYMALKAQQKKASVCISSISVNDILKKLRIHVQ